MNSKKLAIFAILGLLLVGGAGFGLYLKKMNAEGFRGIGFSVQGVEKEKVDTWIQTFETVLQKDEVLQSILETTSYASKLEIPEGEAMAHLKEAVTVNYSKKKSSIQIGLKGKVKQNEQLDDISRSIFTIAAPLVGQMQQDFAVHYQKLSQGG